MIKITNKWYDFASILAASKNKSYKEQVIKASTSLMNFLIEKSLLKIDPFGEDRMIKKDLIIFKDDLTEAGQFLFTSGALYKWLDYTDRSGKLDNFKHLEKALKEYVNITGSVVD